MKLLVGYLGKAEGEESCEQNIIRLSLQIKSSPVPTEEV